MCFVMKVNFTLNANVEIGPSSSIVSPSTLTRERLTSTTCAVFFERKWEC